VKINIQLYLFKKDKEQYMPKPNFKEKITISSDIFYKICKKISINSTAIKITSINNEVKFRGANANSIIEMICEDTNSIIVQNEQDQTINQNEQDQTINQNEQKQIIKNTFMVNDLLNISKCKKLSSNIELYIKDNSPLALVINVGCLGKMYVFISPISK
jgi:hypothetical protein